MQFKKVRVDSLSFDPGNARKHNARNLAAIKDSFDRFGQVEPLVVQKETGKLIGGNGRLKVLRDGGVEETWIVEIDANDTDATALGLALNRTAELATWDDDAMAKALKGLADTNASPVPGFSEADVARALRGLGNPADEVDTINIPKPQRRTELGETWELGGHKLLVGDVFDRLKDIPDESVQCCVTSPPYWGLRDYGTASWDGGDAECDHEVGRKNADHDGDPENKWDGFRDGKYLSQGSMASSTCPKCGAVRVDDQLGLEPTPEEHCANMVRVFAEVKRVLRKDGVCWVNYGDTYSSGCMNGETGPNSILKSSTQENYGNLPPRKVQGLPPKNLVGMPWRVAFALQADGWYLRSDVIWHKPNPMPESVTDRPTKSHEYMFLLSKSAKYFYDADAVREEPAPGNDGTVSVAPHGDHVLKQGHRAQVIREYDEIKGRNLRDVWTIPTQPMPDAHFATYPEKLIEPCIKAGTKEGDAVLDPFGGSGTTMLVAEKESRRAVLVELNPEYADLILSRWEKLTGKEAKLCDSQEPSPSAEG